MNSPFASTVGPRGPGASSSSAWQAVARLTQLNGMRRWPVVIVLLSAMCLYAVYALRARYPFSDDDRAHYLLAHFSWTHPQLLVDVWGRPAYTLLSSPFAQFGIRPAGFFNILVSLLACYVAFELARSLHIGQPWLAAAFTALVPLVVQQSVGTMTEPLFSLLFAGGVLFYLRDRFVESALCLSLLPLARLEGFVFVGIWMVLLLRRGQLKAAVCLLLFPFLWNTTGFLLTREPLYLWRDNPYQYGNDPFDTFTAIIGRHPWLDYFVRWPTITGPALLPLITAGFLGGIGGFVPAVTAAFVLLQTAVYSSGLIGRLSTNEAFHLRLFVGGAPLLGVVAAQGLHYIFEESGTGRRSNTTALVFIVQAILISWWFFAPASPVGRLHLVAAWATAVAAVGVVIYRKDRIRFLRPLIVALLLLTAGAHVLRWAPSSGVSASGELWSDVGQWFRTSEWRTRRVIAVSPAFWIAAARDPFDRTGLENFTAAGGYNRLRQTFASVPAGTVVVWDSHYFPDSKITLESFTQKGFRQIRSWETSDDPDDRFFRRGERKVRVVIFEKSVLIVSQRDLRGVRDELCNWCATAAG